jgi:hypothetical protein
MGLRTQHKAIEIGIDDFQRSPGPDGPYQRSLVATLRQRRHGHAEDVAVHSRHHQRVARFFSEIAAPAAQQ